MSDTAKVIELIGRSSESWDAAAQNALSDASETLEQISGFEVISQTANVEDGAVEEYKTTIHVSFALQR